jgi:uncharacterized DUF497 family protein
VELAMDFRWNEWNLDHATSHGVSVEEIEALIENATSPYPQYRGDDKWLVQGRGLGGRFIQAIYLMDDEGTIFVIHARPLEEHEKRRYRRRLR